VTVMGRNVHNLRLQFSLLKLTYFVGFGFEPKVIIKNLDKYFCSYIRPQVSSATFISFFCIM